MEPLTLPPIQKIEGKVHLPGSKSLSNRTLVLSMLASGDTIIENLLTSDDVNHMLQALEDLGVQVDQIPDRVIVHGCAGAFPASTGNIFVGNSGTTIRLLTAALTLGEGVFVLDGVLRMRERPIKDLVDALLPLGADIRYLKKPGYPPLEIHAKGLSGGNTEISGAISSQFLSALLMAAPYASDDVCLTIRDKLVSAPYVDMTIRHMARFGVNVEHKNFQEFFIRGNQMYQSPGDVFVEGDASSATYFLAGAAITGGTVTVHGCGSDSLQGDAQFAKVLEQMGAAVYYEPHAVTVTGQNLKGIDIDMNDMPDAAMTLAVVGLFAEGPTAIRNIYNWRVKETERMVAMVTELRKLGADVEEGEDYLIVHPPTKWQPADIDTYDDHRIAMAFALAACGPVSVTINDPGCTSKTFPTYFEVLKSLIH